MADETTIKLYTVTVYTENTVGILNQISIIFTRRNLNIWSLTVSPSALEGIHKFTIAVRTDHRMIEAVVRAIEKRVEVLKAFYYTDDEIIYQEIALYKVKTDNVLSNEGFEALVRESHAHILEINRTYTVLQKTGHCTETRELLEALQPYGVLQFVRSGRVAITKSTVERLSRFIELQARREHGLGDRQGCDDGK